MIEIVPYNSNWPLEFEAIAAALRSALDEMALRIDHIGSTSIPALAAKDIIDVQLAVARFDEHLVQALGGLGYTLREAVTTDHQPPGWSGPAEEWEKQYYNPPPGQRPTHLHVRILGRANQRYPLLFRDYLRCHPAAAAGYEALKRVLAQYHAEDRVVYTLIKDPVCDVIMSAAEDWARQTGWVENL